MSSDINNLTSIANSSPQLSHRVRGPSTHSCGSDSASEYVCRPHNSRPRYGVCVPGPRWQWPSLHL